MNKHSVSSAKDFKIRIDNNEIKRSTFQRNQIVKTTYNSGQLVPIYIDEVLPGDTHEISLSHLTRMITPIFPTMDNLELDFYFFFVPNRIVWNGWQKLNGENQSTAFIPTSEPALCPVVVMETPADPLIFPSNSIADYYGLPTKRNLRYCSINALPFRGYASIWNRWFRDENLQAPITIDVSDGNLQDTTAGEYHPQFPLFKVNKLKDYFTSAVPMNRKPVVNSTGTIRSIDWLKSVVTFPTNTDALAKSIYTQTATDTLPGSVTNNQNMIQAIRNAMQLNKLLERDMRSGTRYIEMIKAHFGVDAEDYRLQYPEYLGSAHDIIGIQQVPQTSSTDATSPQGNISAYSVTSGNHKIFNKTFVEHGYIHGFAVVRCKKTYQEGLERFWKRRDRFDYYYPELANIGDQPIYQYEIYAGGLGSTDDNQKVFGFQEAWADYKYKPNRLCGQFRSNHTYTLDAWHYGDKYSSAPVLSNSFIVDNTSTNLRRTLAVADTNYNELLSDILIANTTSRPMPMFSIPGLADHF